ncbi:hypothetical protein ABI59_16630 [Acidobacteria bacterium Mor1]|nr:hypothetical protein ABI59_16630 [Acidobacteria bacterium Mor1]
MNTTFGRLCALTTLLLLLLAVPAMAATVVPGGTLATDTVWNLAGSPYQVQGSLFVEGSDGADGITTLTIEPGVEVHFQGVYSIFIGSFSSPGALVADAQGGARIVFGSDDPSPGAGDWQAIRFRSGAGSSSVMRNVHLEHGGAGGFGTVFLDQGAGETIELTELSIANSLTHGLRVQDGDFLLADCDLRQSGSHDIRLDNSTAVTGIVQNCTTIESLVYDGNNPSVQWSGNTFDEWGARPSRVRAEDAASLTSNNTFVAAPGGGRLELVASGRVARDGTWTAGAGPLVMLGNIAIQGSDGPDGITTLDIAPGTEIRAAGAYAFQVGGTFEPGDLVADAGAGSPIAFRGAFGAGNPGDWQGLHFRDGAGPGSVLRNVIVEHAGAGSWGGIRLQQGLGEAILLEDVTVQHSSIYGIRAQAATLDIRGCRVEHNGDHDIFLENAAITGTVQNCISLESIFYEGVNPSVDWTGNTFNEWNERRSTIAANDMGPLSGNNTFNHAPHPAKGDTESNHLDAPLILGEPIARTTDVYAFMGPLQVTGDIDIQAAVTLQPGVDFAFDGPHRMFVGRNAPGSLTAIGTEQEPILFRSAEENPTQGDWRGLVFDRMAMSGRLEHVTLRDTGISGDAGITVDSPLAPPMTFSNLRLYRNLGGIRARDGDLSISDSDFFDENDEGNQDYDLSSAATYLREVSLIRSRLRAVQIAAEDTLLQLTDNTFSNFGETPSRIPAKDIESFQLQNTFSYFGSPRVEVTGGRIRDDAQWQGDWIYEVIGSIFAYDENAPQKKPVLTLNPGTRVETSVSPAFTAGGPAGEEGKIRVAGTPGLGRISVSTGPGTTPARLFRARSGGELELIHALLSDALDAAEVVGGLFSASDVTIRDADRGIVLDGAQTGTLTRLNIGKDVGMGIYTINTAATVSDSNLQGNPYAIMNNTPASDCVDATGNWFGADDGPSGSAPAQGCETGAPPGSGAMVSEGVRYTGWLNARTGDGDGIPDDQDNCPDTTNPSQRDGNGNGIGDACELPRRFYVSKDPADMPDFRELTDMFDEVDLFPDEMISASVEGGFPDGYRGSSVTLEGNTVEIEGSPRPVEPGGEPQNPKLGDGAAPGLSIAGPGSMFMVQTDIDGLQASMDPGDLSLLQATISGDVDVALGGGKFFVEDANFPDGARMEDTDTIVIRAVMGVLNHIGFGATFEDVTMNSPTTCFSGQGGSYRFNRVTAECEDIGLALTDAFEIAVQNTVLKSSTGTTGLDIKGPPVDVLIEHTSITGYDTGVRRASNFAGEQSGTLTVENSIVWGNAIDLDGVTCGEVSWSNVGTPDCSGQQNNISADPLFDVDGRLLPGSPCIDHGDDPALYTGDPASDLDGGPRLRDHGGGGLARSDCGAYERFNDLLAPGEVLNLIWEDKVRMSWDAEPNAVRYHLYRDDVANLAWSGFAVCRDDLDANDLDELYDEPAQPAAGQTWVYLVTAEDAVGNEGTLGFASGAERSNFNPCP